MVTMQLSQLSAEVDGFTVCATLNGPGHSEKPLLVTLHGGLYTSRYFDVPGGPDGSFLDLAAAAGFSVLSIERPGYGESTVLPPEQDTYERQAELISGAIAQLVAELSIPGVVLVGHSIGGMIAVTLAAGDTSFPLLGVSVTGMGAVIPAGGASEGLAAVVAASGLDSMSVPAEQADPLMFGPDWTFDPAVVESARESYAPSAPAAELALAPKWAAEKLPGLAPSVTVPVHNELAEFDALWDSSPESLARFESFFTQSPYVDVRLARGTGHSIDHHRLGSALHLRQLAFAQECTVLAERPKS